MIIAEIRKKLAGFSGEDDTTTEEAAMLLDAAKEDLLTADLFGALRYLPRDPYLATVLEMLADGNPYAEVYRQHAPSLIDSAESMVLDFWPSFRTPPELPGMATEPDVLIRNDKYFVLVEAKLHSGFGELQVERQLLIALREAKAARLEPFLILVTGAGSPPRFRIGARRMAVGDFLAEASQRDDIPDHVARVLEANADRVVWVSWQGLLNAIRKGHARFMRRKPIAAWLNRCGDMVHDLEALMLLRGIRPFSGFPSHLPRINQTAGVFLNAKIAERKRRSDFHGIGRSFRHLEVLPLHGWSLSGFNGGQRHHRNGRIEMALNAILGQDIKPIVGWHMYPTVQ